MELQNGVTIALLAYKEAENLRIILPKIIDIMMTMGVEFDIVIVDTHISMDNTREVCQIYGAEYYNQNGKGFGDAFRTAISKADRRLFLILDADGSHDPACIPAMYERFCETGCDLVIGSRYIEGGKTCDSAISVILSRILNGLFRFFLGIKARDISTDYRLYKTEQLKAVKLVNTHYDVLQEVLIKLKLNKPDFNIQEVPITFYKRVFGESKRKLLAFSISYMKTLVQLTIIRVRGG